MSRVNRMLNVEPLVDGGCRETLVSVGHRCAYCCGNGWYWGTDDDGEDTRVTCPICNGKAELDAVISITWMPTCKE